MLLLFIRNHSEIITGHFERERCPDLAKIQKQSHSDVAKPEEKHIFLPNIQKNSMYPIFVSVWPYYIVIHITWYFRGGHPVLV